MAEITPAERARLAALLAQAKLTLPIEEGQAGNANIVHFDGDDITAVALTWSAPRRALIVAAVNALPALLAACDAAEAERAAIERASALTDDEKRRAADRALRALYVAVDASVADDVNARVRAAFVAADECARDAYRRGQERMRERASVMLRAFVDADHRVGRDVRTLREVADAIAALPIPDAEEETR